MSLWTLANTATLRWYEADALSLSDTDPVDSFTDLSGNADHAVQSVAGNKPVFKTNIINSLPVVRFATDDFLTLAELFDSSSSAGAIFVLCKKTGGTDCALLSTRSSAGNTGWTLRLSSTTAGLYFHTGATPNVDITTIDAQFNLIEVIRSGNNITVGCNGTMASPVTLSGFTSSTYDLTSIGAEQSATGSFLDGDIVGIAVLPSVPDDLLRKRIEGSWLWKYGLQGSLPADHLYKAAAPVNDVITATVGGTLVLSGTVSAATYNADMSGILLLSGEIATETYNAVMSGALQLSGTMDAGLTSATVGGVLTLSGEMEMASDVMFDISGMLRLSGSMTAVADVPLEITGALMLSGVMEAQSFSVADITGVLALSGTMEMASTVGIEITGNLALSSYIAANNGAAACSIQPHNSLQWS